MNPSGQTTQQWTETQSTSPVVVFAALGAIAAVGYFVYKKGPSVVRKRRQAEEEEWYARRAPQIERSHRLRISSGRI